MTSFHLPTEIPKKTRAKLFLFALLAYFITSSGRFYSHDGLVMFSLTKALVDDRSAVVEKYVGERYSKYGPMQSLLAVPLYAASKVTRPLEALVAAGKADMLWGDWVLGLFNVFVTSVSVLVMAAAAAELGVSAAAAAATALLWGFTTMAWPYAKHDFSEPLLTLFMLCALLYAWRSVRRGSVGLAALAGMFFGFSILTKYVNAALAPVFLLAVLGAPEGRWKRAAAFAAPVAACVAAALLYNYARFGSFLETGYHMEVEYQRYRARGSWIECAYGVLFSGGKSLFVYSPPLLLAIVGAGDFLKRSRMFAAVIALSLAACIAIYSRLSYWGGGLAWGPRYFLPCVGMGMWMAAPFIGRALEGGWRRWRLPLVAALAAAGVAIQLLAISVRLNTAYENGEVDTCIHVWMTGAKPLRPPLCKNPIVKEWEVLRERAPRMARVAGEALRGEPKKTGWPDSHKNTYLDFWQLYLLPALPKWRAWALLAFTFAMVCAAAALLRGLIRGEP